MTSLAPLYIKSAKKEGKGRLKATLAWRIPSENLSDFLLPKRTHIGTQRRRRLVECMNKDDVKKSISPRIRLHSGTWWLTRQNAPIQ